MFSFIRSSNLNAFDFDPSYFFPFPTFLAFFLYFEERTLKLNTVNKKRSPSFFHWSAVLIGIGAKLINCFPIFFSFLPNIVVPSPLLLYYINEFFKKLQVPSIENTSS